MSLFSPFKVFGKFQPVDEPEDCCAVILNGDRLNQFAERCLIEGRQQIRPIFQNVQKFLRALDRLIVLGAQYAGFLQLCLAALFGQLIAAGYKKMSGWTMVCCLSWASNRS